MSVGPIWFVILLKVLEIKIKKFRLLIKRELVNCAEFVRDRYMFKDVGYGLSKHTKAMP